MEQKYNSDEIEIDLIEIFMMLLRWAWAIALAALVGALITFCYSNFFITPTYESTTRIFMLDQQTTNTSLTVSDLNLGTQLTNNYKEMIKSRTVVESVINTFELDTTYESFVKNNIAISSPTNTSILNITITDTDPLRAKEMADELCTVFAERVKEIMDTDAVNVVDEGNTPIEPAAPSIFKYTLIGFLAGGFLAVAVLVVLYLLDDTVKTSEDVEKYLGLSTLGLIPIIEADDNRKRRPTPPHKRDLEEEREEREAREYTKKMAVIDLNDEQQ